MKKVLRHLVVASSSALVLAASSASAASTYAEVETIVADACLSCHAADVAYGDIVLETEADLTAQAAAVLAVLEVGAMPLGNPEFKDSAEGQALIAYLKGLK